LRSASPDSIALGLGHLGQLDPVVQAGFQVTDLVDTRGQAIALAHDLLRTLGIVPERWVLGERVQLVEADKGFVPVKDASAKGPRLL
jgi:hypothetical protein